MGGVGLGDRSGCEARRGGRKKLTAFHDFPPDATIWRWSDEEITHSGGRQWDRRSGSPACAR